MRVQAGVVASMLVIVACGGKFADDTSTDPDPNPTDAAIVPETTSDGGAAPPDVAEAASPPSPGCTDTVIDISQTGDQCVVAQKWACGSGHYELRCSCPSGTCECLQGGVQMKAFTGVQCPGCIETPGDMNLCPFPH